MSVEAMAWVWKNGPNDPTERLVLLAIADHADDHGWCYPSMIGIATKACVTERGARGIHLIEGARASHLGLLFA